MVVKLNEAPIKKDKGYSSINSNYKSDKKDLEMVPLIPAKANLEVEYSPKKIIDHYPYQPLPNQDVPYNLLSQNQQEVSQDKNESEYSSHIQGMGINTVNYQSYVGKAEERDKDVIYSFPAQDNLIDKSEQENQYKPKSKIKEESYQSNYGTNDIKTEKEAKMQLTNKADFNNYKKMYGNYDKSDLNIEDNTDDTHQLLQEKDDIKRISSEERNYRVLNMPHENKLEEYQPKQYDKYSAGNYSSMDQFNRYSTRQPGYPNSASSSVKRKEANSAESGYSAGGYQSKLNAPPQKENEANTTGYSSTFDLRNKVNDLRSQISNYTRDQKQPQDNNLNYIDYTKIRGNQKPNMGVDYSSNYYK